MKHKLMVLALSGFVFASCAKKTETTGMSDSVTTHTEQTPSTAPATTPPANGMGMNNSTMKMSGKIDEDMVMMGKMMVSSLGAADANYDDRFITMMIPHHEGAVSMSKDALTKTSKPELKKLAQSIITAQEKEIAQMKAWDKQWYSHEPTEGNMAMMNTQMTGELGPAGAEYEDHFIDGMIPHHESAIEMAKDALQKSTHPELKQLAKNIISSQQAEIDLMKKYRQAWYGH